MRAVTAPMTAISPHPAAKVILPSPMAENTSVNSALIPKSVITNVNPFPSASASQMNRANPNVHMNTSRARDIYPTAYHPPGQVCLSGRMSAKRFDVVFKRIPRSG